MTWLTINWQRTITFVQCTHQGDFRFGQYTQLFSWDAPIKKLYYFYADCSTKATFQSLFFFKCHHSIRERCPFKVSPQIDSKEKRILTKPHLGGDLTLFTDGFPASLFTEEISNFVCLSEKWRPCFVCHSWQFCDVNKAAPQILQIQSHPRHMHQPYKSKKRYLFAWVFVPLHRAVYSIL